MSDKKIVLLGGSGDMGLGVLEDLITFGLNIEITVIDLNTDLAKDLLTRIENNNNNKINFFDLNFQDPQILPIIRNSDVTINAIGPFYKYGFEIASIIINEGINFVDICDDPDATLMELSLDSYAKKKKSTAIIGCGWTPGLSNILAKKLSAGFDEIFDINIYWVGSTSDASGTAVIGHVFHVIKGQSYMYINKRWQLVPNGSFLEKIKFPDPIGEQNVYYGGHPEPLTIPLYIDTANVTVKGCLIPEEANSIASLIEGLGFLETESRTDLLIKRIKPLLPLISQIGKKALPISGLKVKVKGKIKDNIVEKSLISMDAMRRITGIPASICALMLISGNEYPFGVYSPEGIIQVDFFLNELNKRDIEILSER